VSDVTPVFREPTLPEQRQRRTLVRAYFLQVRGPHRGAMVEKVERINKKTIRVRLVERGGTVDVPLSAVRREAPSRDARVVRGGLPGLGRR
jgi:hypothetical protein